MVRKGNLTLTFDYMVTTGTSQLYDMRIIPEGTQEEAINISVGIRKESTSSPFEENEQRMSEPLDPDLHKVDTVVQAAVVTSPRARKVTKQMTHYLFGQMSLRDAVAAAKHIGNYDVLPGGVVMCEPCMVAKARELM